jgi:copper(I)-binding protein
MRAERHRKLICAVAIFALQSHAALAAQITVSNAWIRALPGHLPAGGYFVLANASYKPVALTGASSKDCGMLMLHRSDLESGMAKMSGVESVMVPAHGSIAFSPGAYHLMCTDPNPRVKPGAKIEISLTFSDGTELTAPFAVRNARGR